MTRDPAPPDTAEREARPCFHLTPPANWMNDPNGPFFHEGRLHVFYQHNPVAPHWDRVHWGHAVTSDFVTWEHRPVAISPDPDGPDAFGCWSGCVVDDDGGPTMLYTGVVQDGQLRRASICLARSSDGLETWVKDPGNPVIPGAPAGIAADSFRDPFVWKDDEGWAMLVGAGTIDGAGVVLIYRSSDLRTWTLGGRFLSASDLPDSRYAGGPCWECPQLLRFGERALLILSITNPAPGSRPSHVIAISGRIEDDRFLPEHLVRLDGGPDYYAPAAVIAPDGRHLLLGWIPEDPPEEASSRDWAGALTLPRVVSLRPEGGLTQVPAEELARLRSSRRHLLEAAPRTPFQVPVSDHFELLASFTSVGESTVGIAIFDDDGPEPEARIAFRPGQRCVSVTRRGTVEVGGPDESNVMIIPPDEPSVLELRVIVDGSVMEVFADGRTAATFRLPSIHRGLRRVATFSEGAADRLVCLEIWSLDPRRLNALRAESCPMG